MEIDFEIYVSDSKNVRIPVYDVAGNPVDLTAASIEWHIAEWMGAPPLLSKHRVAGGAETEIGIEPGVGSLVPNQMVVKILEDEIDWVGGIYVHHAVVSYIGARDTVKVGMVSVMDAPIAA